MVTNSRATGILPFRRPSEQTVKVCERNSSVWLSHCHMKSSVGLRRRGWSSATVRGGDNPIDDFELNRPRALPGTSDFKHRRRTQSSPAWLSHHTPQVMETSLATVSHAAHIQCDNCVPDPEEQEPFLIRNVASCFKDCFRAPVKLISRFLVRVSPRKRNANLELETVAPPSVPPALSSLETEENDGGFLDEDIGFEDIGLDADSTCSGEASSVPENALVIGGHVVKGSRYRNAHTPCPFTSESTPSPELLAGRPQRNKKHQQIPSGESMGACEPMAVRKAMVELRNARDHSIQAYYEEEYRKNFVVREWKHMKRRITPDYILAKPKLVRSKGSLT